MRKRKGWSERSIYGCLEGVGTIAIEILLQITLSDCSNEHAIEKNLLKVQSRT